MTVKHQIDHITITGLCNKLQFFTVKRYILDEILQYFFLFMLETQIVGTPHLRVTTYEFTTSRAGTYLRNVVFRRGFVSI